MCETHSFYKRYKKLDDKESRISFSKDIFYTLGLYIFFLLKW